MSPERVQQQHRQLRVRAPTCTCAQWQHSTAHTGSWLNVCGALEGQMLPASPLEGQMLPARCSLLHCCLPPLIQLQPVDKNKGFFMGRQQQQQKQQQRMLQNRTQIQEQTS